jgi:hypothetical protein
MVFCARNRIVSASVCDKRRLHQCSHAHTAHTQHNTRTHAPAPHSPSRWRRRMMAAQASTQDDRATRGFEPCSPAHAHAVRWCDNAHTLDTCTATTTRTHTHDAYRCAQRRAACDRRLHAARNRGERTTTTTSDTIVIVSHNTSRQSARDTITRVLTALATARALPALTTARRTWAAAVQPLSRPAQKGV